MSCIISSWLMYPFSSQIIWHSTVALHFRCHGTFVASFSFLEPRRLNFTGICQDQDQDQGNLCPWQNTSYPLCSSGRVTKSLWFIFSQISNLLLLPCWSVIMLCWWIRSLKNAFLLTYWTYSHSIRIQLCRHAEHFDSFPTSPRVCTW